MLFVDGMSPYNLQCPHFVVKNVPKVAPIPKPAPSPSPVQTPPASPPSPPPDTATAAALAPNIPLHLLGPLLSAAAAAVADRTQAPVELAAHHMLTLAAMAAQRLVSLRLPTGQQRPVSCYFMTVVGAGERRGAAEKLMLDPVRLWEQSFAEEFPMRVLAHVEEGVLSGARQPQPVPHLHLFFDPPRSGVFDRYGRFTRASGLFARHPHDLVQPVHRRRQEAASLCALWDGKVIAPAHRSASASAVFPRLSLHLVATPRASSAFLGDGDLADSGLLSRMLCLKPASRIGERVWTARDTDDPPLAFTAALTYLCALYAQPVTAATRVLGFSHGAVKAWLAFAQEMEQAMAPTGDFALLRPIAGRLPEHAARLAAVLALMEDCALEELSAAHIENGIVLARFYAREALRLADLAPAPLSENEKEDLLKDWLEHRRAGEEVTLRDVCRLAPAPLRDADTAYKLMRRMERLGIVQPRGAYHGATAPRRTRTSYQWRVGLMSQDVA